MRRTSIGFLFLCSLAACTTPEQPLADSVDALVDDSNARLTNFCDCYVELGYPSGGECERDLGFVGSAQRTCVTTAYEQNETASRDYHDCVIPLSEDYTTCVAERLDCSNLDALGICDTDYDAGFAECVLLPQGILDDLEACYE
ncbi:hypothetical protein ACNOYE_11955 [Nannocystaceae bacterium ST9]